MVEEAWHLFARNARRILQWTAKIGAVTAEALACHLGTSIESARAQLAGAVRERQLVRERPLSGQPALYTLTRSGAAAIRAAGHRQLSRERGELLHLIRMRAGCSGAGVQLPRTST